MEWLADIQPNVRYARSGNIRLRASSTHEGSWGRGESYKFTIEVLAGAQWVEVECYRTTVQGTNHAEEAWGTCIRLVEFLFDGLDPKHVLTREALLMGDLEAPPPEAA